MTRKLIWFLMALCMTMMTSCKKDYNALFCEHMAELNKESKYILCQKNDSADHYIVYMDVDKIMVDTLGDSPKEYPLGKLNVHEYKATIQEGKFCLKSFEAPYFTIKTDTLKKEMTVSVEGQEGWFVTTKFSDIKANRDYLTFGFYAFNEDTRSVYLFLTKNWMYTFSNHMMKLKKRKMVLTCLFLDQVQNFGIQYQQEHQKNSVQKNGQQMPSWTSMVTLLANPTMFQFMELIFQPLHLEHQISIVIIQK